MQDLLEGVEGVGVGSLFMYFFRYPVVLNTERLGLISLNAGVSPWDALSREIVCGALAPAMLEVAGEGDLFGESSRSVCLCCGEVRVMSSDCVSSVQNGFIDCMMELVMCCVNEWINGWID